MAQPIRHTRKAILPRAATPKRAAPASPQRTNPSPSASQHTLADLQSASPASIFALQQQYGNRAVGRLLQRKAPIGAKGGDLDSGLQDQINHARGGGQPLDRTVGSQVGGALGADLSGVRVHTDEQSDTLNRSLSAKAFTLGSDVFFSQGAYNPGTHRGQQLLAHELTHVVQQGGSKNNKVQTKLMVGPANDAYEQEAEQVSKRVAAGNAASLTSRSGDQPTIAAGQPVVQRLMAYKQFQAQVDKEFQYQTKLATKEWRKGLTKENKAEIKQHQQAIKKGYQSAVPTVLSSFNIKESNRKAKIKGIDLAYQAYDKDPNNLGNLARLHDAITAWQTANFMHIKGAKDKRTDPEAAQALSLNFVFQNLLDELKPELQKKTVEQGGKAQSADEMLDTSDSQDVGSLKMPFAFEDVGIAPGYYKANLQNKPAEELLEQLYTNFYTGDLKEASELLGNPVLTALPGFPLIRSLFLSHFSNAAQLGEMVGAKQGKGELTEDEEKALKAYTASSDPANAALRAVDLSGEKITAALQYKLVVSALSKLQPHKGVAYRGINPYGAMDAVWQVGATVADLAFTSAAASIEGVEYYLKETAVASARGKQNYYCIIKSRTAVHVSNRSHFPREAEIIFRPGTRFRIKAIWKHNEAEKVPPNAPTEAQMILHRVGKYKTETGKDKYDWEKHRKFEEKDPGEFKDQNLHQVKVFELVEL